MRYKICLIISFAIFIIISAYLINYVNRSIVLKGIEDIEIRQSEIDIKELYGVFIGAIIRLRQHTVDQAVLDDTYEYINNLNNHYIEKIYSKSRSHRNHLTGTAYYNNSGERLAFIDASEGKFGNEWLDSEKMIFDKAVNKYKNMNDDYIEGYISVNNVKMIVIIHKIYDTNKMHQSNGYVIAALALDNTFQRLADSVSNFHQTADSC